MSEKGPDEAQLLTSTVDAVLIARGSCVEYIDFLTGKLANLKAEGRISDADHENLSAAIADLHAWLHGRDIVQASECY